MTDNTNEYEIMLNPRQQGRFIKQWMDFYVACRKGEKIVGLIPEGEIMSPALAKARLAAHTNEVLNKVLSEIEKLYQPGLNDLERDEFQGKDRPVVYHEQVETIIEKYISKPDDGKRG